MSNESKTIKKHPDFNEWLKSADGLSSNDINTLTEQKYLTNRLFWAFDAGRNCVWDQYLQLKAELERLKDENFKTLVALSNVKIDAHNAALSEAIEKIEFRAKTWPDSTEAVIEILEGLKIKP